MFTAVALNNPLFNHIRMTTHRIYLKIKVVMHQARIVLHEHNLARAMVELTCSADQKPRSLVEKMLKHYTRLRRIGDVVCNFMCGYRDELLRKFLSTQALTLCC